VRAITERFVTLQYVGAVACHLVYNSLHHHLQTKKQPTAETARNSTQR
jgi:hypothetical protein